MHGCDPGRVSDGSRLALCQTLSSIECPSSIFFWHVYFVILVPFSLSFLFVFFVCSRWSFVDVPPTFFCPADHVPDWQPRTLELLGMVEARSVNVKKTTTTTPIFRINIYIPGRLFKCFKTKIYAPRIRTKPCLVLLLYCSTIVLLPLLFENPLLILLLCLL